jgi:hypothetical protein
MITVLRARNFKSWRDTGQLRLAPLTGLFGTNSSGKTSLLQILLMLKETVSSPDRKLVLNLGGEYSPLDLGTFSDIVHNHDLRQELELEFAWTLPEALEISDPERQDEALYQISDLSFDVVIAEQAERPVVRHFGYKFGGNEYGMRWTSAKPDGKHEYELIHGAYPARRTQGRAWPLPAPVKCYGFPDEATTYYQNVGFLPDFELSFVRLFSELAYLGPLRSSPQRRYIWGGERPPDVGWDGSEAVAALLAARSEGLESGRGQGKGRRYKSVEGRVNEWLHKMGLAERCRLEPIAEGRTDQEFRVKTNKAAPEVLITDVGFGVSQVLPVLVLCYYVPEGSTVILEQPEIHLHPSVQAALADVFVDVVKERRVQIIVESHSEHLLRRLQRRIAEGRLAQPDTALYFCQLENGGSHITELEVDPEGNIRNWPEDFFGDTLGDLVAMTDAAMSRAGGTR